MKQFSFLTIGDQAYFHSIYYSIQNINALYPETPVYIYDWGFTASQLQRLRNSSNVTVVPWEKRFFDVSIHFGSWRERISLVYKIRSLEDFLHYVKKPGRILNDQAYASFLKREMLFANKVLCMQDYVKSHGENFIFLDGDAVLMKRIDELLEDSFDIGVTLREPNEISLSPKSCSVLNTGVLFFLASKKKNLLFLEYWLERMRNTHERFIEQSALTRLLEDVDPAMFENYKERSISISGEAIQVKVLPCRTYNHYRARRHGVREENKIVHFKSLNYRKEVFYKFLEELGLPIPPAANAVQREDL